MPQMSFPPAVYLQSFSANPQVSVRNPQVSIPNIRVSTLKFQSNNLLCRFSNFNPRMVDLHLSIPQSPNVSP
ncbi:unnamed protein product [Meloidogyne enterolobii]|uniref:Uncharacterized protein n=1 Tax=Meloidogyne enterolobii TaxID=390850 RepID=A0ACB1B0B7_MELEN